MAGLPNRLKLADFLDENTPGVSEAKGAGPLLGKNLRAFYGALRILYLSRFSTETGLQLPEKL